MQKQTLRSGQQAGLQTIEQPPVQPLVSSAQQDQTTLVEEYLSTITRHRMAIVLCAFTGLVLSLAMGLGSMPVFRTRTSVDIRSINAGFVEMRSAAPTDGGGGSADNDINVQTQIKLLQSETLFEDTKERLLAAPHPQFIQKEDLISQVLRAFHLGGKEQIPYALLVNDTAQRIKVKPLGMTRLVEITCDSWNAKFAALFCNTLTRTFEEEDQKSRSAEAQKTSDWLTQQATDIRQRAEDSQKRLEAAVGGNGLMLSQMTTTPGEDRLRELQDELVKAQSARIEKEAEAGVARSAAPDSVPDVQDSPEYRAYQLKLADLRGQLAALVPPLTEENPKVIHVRSEIKEAEAGLAATKANSAAREDNELTSARHREDLLKVTYSAQVANVSSDLQKAAQVSLLRREVDSEQQLYQTLLQRAKEAGFASAMQAATIRVIDAAQVPKIAVLPQRKLSGAVGLALGGVFGLGFSFYRDRHHRVFRGPGDVERYLQVHELGVVPTAPTTRRGLAALNPLSRLQLGTEQKNTGHAIQLIRWDDQNSLVAEAYRSVTFSILLSESTKSSRRFVVTSPNSGEGKTTVTTNVGIALSKSRLRVVLVDGDLRRPNLHKSFGLDNGFGLRNILRGEVDLATVPTEVLTHRTWLPNVSVIPAGEGNDDVVELLHSNSLSPLLQRLALDFDVVLIDTPPMAHMADARILANQSDGVILVFRAGTTMRDEAVAARDLFDHDGVHLVGTILNGFDPRSEGKGRYYESYYRYHRTEAETAEKTGATS